MEVIQYSLSDIRKVASEEIKKEEMRRLIDIEKRKILAEKWWHKLIPYKIVFIPR